MKPEAPATAWPVAMLVTAVAYAVTGILSMWVAMPPGYAVPIYPPAGIALVAVLLRGWRMLPGVWLGCFTVNVAVALGRDGVAPMSFVSPAIFGVGALLQAQLAATLVRRYVGAHPTLSEPREVLRFFLSGALLACLVSASVAAPVLWIGGTVGTEILARTWTTWWLGDALGTIIGAPVVLCLVGRPQSVWRLRRRTVALPLLVVTLLASVAINQARTWDEGRTLAVFERDLALVQSAVTLRLRQPQDALEAMRGLFIASEDVSASEFRGAVAAWLNMETPPQAIGMLQWLSSEELPRFVARQRIQFGPDFDAFDRVGISGRAPVSGPESAVIRYLEPLDHNLRTIGLNALSVPSAREAVLRAVATGQPAATAGFRMIQEDDGQVGVVILAPLEAQASAGGRPHGLVSVSLRMQDVLNPALTGLPSYLQVCLFDTDADRSLLAGDPGCVTQATGRMVRALPVEFGQRHWELRVAALGAGPAGLGHQDTWLFAIVSLLAVATFGALLLIMTGRAQRIEAAVAERTVELEREIGERTRTEAALRDSEQRFRNILNHVPIGLIYTDLHGAIKLTNPKLRELLGLSAEQLQDMRVQELTHPDDRRDERELVLRLIAGEITVFQRQERVLRTDGQTLWVRAIVSLLRDAQGRPHRLVAAVEDITEHLRLEAAETGRELAEAANRAKTDFLSRMSHELRTPLNAMLGFAQLIELDREQPLSIRQKDWVSQIQTAGWHLLEMINDTLDLSRIESGTLKLARESMDLRQVIEMTLSLVDRQARSRRLRIHHRVAPEAAQVTGDPTRVKQILTNLLTNAVKYNVDGGSIDVHAGEGPDGDVEISVHDSGLGMSEQQLNGLFQPFNRLGRERSSQEGTGIGLVISRRLAELMGGSLSVQSLEGEGSTFTLRLPRAAWDAADAGGPDEPSREPDYRRRIVHYIEDNETNAVVMEGVLAQRPQVRLRVSSSGLEGLSAVQLRPPSLILLDMHLPDIDGLQLLRLLKEHPVTAGIPVVAVSADALTSRIETALKIGAEAYLTNPVNVPELLRIVDELLEPRDTAFETGF